MSLSLYMDHHVPTAITEGLRRRGVDVLTASDDERERSADEELLHRATQLGRVFFSQDRDLLVIAHRWQEDSRDFAGLIYAHQLAITIGQAVRDLEFISKLTEPEEMRNRIEFLPF